MEKKNKNFENIINFLEKKTNKKKIYFDIFNNLHTLYELQIFYQKKIFKKSVIWKNPEARLDIGKKKLQIRLPY